MISAAAKNRRIATSPSGSRSGAGSAAAALLCRIAGSTAGAAATAPPAATPRRNERRATTRCHSLPSCSGLGSGAANSSFSDMLYPLFLGNSTGRKCGVEATHAADQKTVHDQYMIYRTLRQILQTAFIPRNGWSGVDEYGSG